MAPRPQASLPGLDFLLKLGLLLSLPVNAHTAEVVLGPRFLLQGPGVLSACCQGLGPRKADSLLLPNI